MDNCAGAVENRAGLNLKRRRKEEIMFETLLGAEDAIISDALNHASIIDGVRLCKAKRYRYANNDMQELEARLKEAREAGARHVLIATDGVFSMDGVIANLKGV